MRRSACCAVSQLSCCPVVSLIWGVPSLRLTGRCAARAARREITWGLCPHTPGIFEGRMEAEGTCQRISNRALRLVSGLTCRLRPATSSRRSRTSILVDGVQHELLEAFHAGLRHFSRGIAVVELGDTCRLSSDSAKPSWMNLSSEISALGVDRQAGRWSLFHCGLDVRTSDEGQEFLGVFDVLRVGRNEERVSRGFFRGVQRAGSIVGNGMKSIWSCRQASVLVAVDREVAHHVHRGVTVLRRGQSRPASSSRRGCRPSRIR